MAALGFVSAVINYEALVFESDAIAAVRRVPHASEATMGIYRGWMLRPNQYAQLYDALRDKNICLINSPEQYRHCHFLPESYPLIESRTPRSVWIRTEAGFSADHLKEVLQPFGADPVIVKDFVKSQKHHWADACYIPSASDTDATMNVVSRFVELQGDDLNEGLVFREFVEFEPLADHPQSGMPLVYEYRSFWLDGHLVAADAYWDAELYSEEPPDMEPFAQIARTVQSRFFTMDVAKQLNGDWMIVELGDAQVAGLPPQTDPNKFYRSLRETLREKAVPRD